MNSYLTQSHFINSLKSLSKKVDTKDNNVFIFLTTLIFYLTVWLFSPSYKFIVAAFVLLFLFLNFRIKNYKFALLITFLISSVLYIGKTYVIELIPGGIYDPIYFEDGLLAYLVVTPSNVFAAIMLFIIVRDLVNKKLLLKDFYKHSYLLIIYITWTILSDLFVSKKPGLSLAFNLLSLNPYILYFYLQAYIKDGQKFYKIFIFMLAALCIFETILSVKQFTANSLTGNSLVYQAGSAYWGNQPDERNLSYRPVGTFFHANSLGAEFSIWLLLLIVYYLVSGNSLILIAVVPAMLIFLLTLSRSSWMGFLAGLLTILYIVEKVKKFKINIKLPKYTFFFAVPLIAILIYFVLPRFQKSFYSFDQGGGTFRVEQFVASAELISKNFVMGVGKKMVVPEGLETLPQSIFGKIPLDIHNFYLSVAAEHGVPALIFYLYFVILSVAGILKNKLKTKGLKNSEMPLLSLIGIMFSFGIVSIFSVISGEIYLMLFLGFLNERQT